MTAALAFLVATVAEPPPQHLYPLFSLEDYPPAALKRGEQGPVYVEMIVNPEGRVDGCVILFSSGYQDLDDATCRIVTARARFSPAQNENGKAIYSTYRHVIQWRINDEHPPSAIPKIPPDLDLTINQAPPGVKLPLQLNISYFVKANGSFGHCQISSISKPPPQVLVDLACNAVMHLPIEVIRNHDNVPVDASETATVRFSTGTRAQ